MTPTEEKAFELALPLVEYGLQLLLPEVPSIVWQAVFAGIKAGDGLSGDAVRAALKEAGITLSYAPQDFPDEPPGDKVSQ